MQLKGIGPKRAADILELRENCEEPFKLQDLENIGLSDRQCLPTQAPQPTDVVIALLTEILVEGLLDEKSPEKAQSGEASARECDEGSTNVEETQLQQDHDEEKNLSMSAEDDSAKMIRILQHSLEKLMDENDKLLQNNKSLEMEVSACARLFLNQ